MCEVEYSVFSATSSDWFWCMAAKNGAFPRDIRRGKKIWVNWPRGRRGRRNYRESMPAKLLPNFQQMSKCENFLTKSRNLAFLFLTRNKLHLHWHETAVCCDCVENPNLEILKWKICNSCCMKVFVNENYNLLWNFCCNSERFICSNLLQNKALAHLSTLNQPVLFFLFIFGGCLPHWCSWTSNVREYTLEGRRLLLVIASCFQCLHLTLCQHCLSIVELIACANKGPSDWHTSGVLSHPH